MRHNYLAWKWNNDHFVGGRVAIGRCVAVSGPRAKTRRAAGGHRSYHPTGEAAPLAISYSTNLARGFLYGIGGISLER